MKPFEAALQVPWRASVGLRNLFFEQRGPSLSLDAPVLSVGNLVLGGAGKTPFVRCLVRLLRALGRRPGVLTRGYGGVHGPLPFRVGPDTSPRRCGDEAKMLSADPGLVVVVDPKRDRGGALALELGADVLVLDDGYQHRRLFRDLDVLLLTAEDAAGRFPPLGVLREPRRAAGRADVRVWSEIDEVAPADADVRIDVRVPEWAFEGGEGLRGETVGLVAGIARPHRFRRLVERCGARVVATYFARDHAPISSARVRALRTEVPGARLLTTEKDRARCPGLDAEVVPIEYVLRSGADVLRSAVIRALRAGDDRRRGACR